MFLQKISWIFFIAVTLVTKCHGFKTIIKQPVSKGTVNGGMMRYCEYKLLKMLPKSKVLDPDACLSCKCNNKFLICRDAKYIPGCKSLLGGQWTENPFDKKWKNMINPLIKPNYVGQYKILQVRSQVVAGTNHDMQLLVENRLCDLTIFRNMFDVDRITKDPCGLKK